jgi:sugar phosphate isomerase/epimerase
MVPLALAHLTVLDVAPPALFDLAAEAGYRSVGIRILPAAPGAICYPLNTASLAEWRRSAMEAGVEVYDVEFLPLTTDVQVESYARTLALAGELGAKRLNVSGDDTDTDRLVERFGKLCDLASDAGIGVDLEFMRFRTIGTLQQALDVITRAARPNGRLLIDVLHLFRSGGTAQMLADLPANAIGSVQLSDAPQQDPTDARVIEEAREARLFPGEGELPLKAFLDALPRSTPMGVEVPTGLTHPQLTAKQRARAAFVAAQDLLAAGQPRR